MRVIILNGPPRCGKDTAASMLPGYKTKLSKPLKDGVQALFGIGKANSVDYERAKDTEFPIFFNASYRQRQIDVFHFLERIAGPSVLGEILVAKLKRIARYIRSDHGDLVILSDGGRFAEIAPIIDAFGIDNVLVVHIYRDGCTFEKDIRSYVDAGTKIAVVSNNGTKDDYKKELYEAITNKVDWLKNWIV